MLEEINQQNWSCCYLMEITATFANLSNVKVNHPDSDFIFHFIYNFSRMTWLFFFIFWTCESQHQDSFWIAVSLSS